MIEYKRVRITSRTYGVLLCALKSHLITLEEFSLHFLEQGYASEAMKSKEDAECLRSFIEDLERSKWNIAKMV